MNRPMSRCGWFIPSLVAALLPLAGAVADETPVERDARLTREFLALLRDGQESLQSGQPGTALKAYEKALPLAEQLFSLEKYPRGRPELHGVILNIALAHEGAGQPAKALPYYERALEIRRKMYPVAEFPTGHLDLVRAITMVARVLESLGRNARSAEVFTEAAEMMSRLYPEGNLDVAQSHAKLGQVFEAAGNFPSAKKHFDIALAIYRKLYPPAQFPKGHLELAKGLFDEGKLHIHLRQCEQAIEYLQQCLEMRRRLMPEEQLRKGHPLIVSPVRRMGQAYMQLRQWNRAIPLLQEAHSIASKIAESGRPRDRQLVVEVVDSLAEALHETGEYQQSIDLLVPAIAEARRLMPKGSDLLARMLNGLGLSYKALDQNDQAITAYEQALAMFRTLEPIDRYPDGSIMQFVELNNLAVAHGARGDDARSMTLMTEALAMGRRLTKSEPSLHLDSILAGALNNFAHHLEIRGQGREALKHYEEALQVYRRIHPRSKYPSGHRDEVPVLTNLGLLNDHLGHPERAIVWHEEAVAVARASMPGGPKTKAELEFLQAPLKNLSGGLMKSGQRERTLAVHEEIISLCQRLYPEASYPNGHPDLADAHHNVAVVLASLGRENKALNHSNIAIAMFEKAFAGQKPNRDHMRLQHAYSVRSIIHFVKKHLAATEADATRAMDLIRAIYPPGSGVLGRADVATAVALVGRIRVLQGRAAEALPLLQEAIGIVEQLEPNRDAPIPSEFVEIRRTLGMALDAIGQRNEAMTQFELALRQYAANLERFAAASAESDALNFVFSNFGLRDQFLQSSRTLPGSDGRVYEAVWRTKAAIMQVFQARHAATVVNSLNDAGLKRRFEELLDVRRELSRTAGGKRANSEQVRRLTEVKERLEREIAGMRPELVDAGPPPRPFSELARQLPPGCVWIDLYHYSHSRGDRYAAFVALPGKAIRRVEIGEAAPINKAIHTWRINIDRGNPTPEAEEIAAKLWAPIAALLPAETRTVYLSPDGDLARVPWCAIPEPKTDRILLERFEGGIATLPSGAMLLTQLGKVARPITADDAVAYGDAGYAPNGLYAPLPGTAAEVAQIRDLAGKARFTLRAGNDASVLNLMRDLPRSRIAHIATHGFFDEQGFENDTRLAQKRLDQWQMGASISAAPPRSPLLFVGLALANAGQPMQSDGLVTGEMIVGLPLDQLRLCVLSACDTGLGQFTGGEGVMGLQRAFHIAGCPNVIASLWKVNDIATAALMVKFYREMWVNNKDPLAALRDAQLTVYYRPDLISELAGERGAPRLKDAVAVKPTRTSSGAGARRSATRLWAAFSLSGTGR